jgi:hypothetical protein
MISLSPFAALALVALTPDRVERSLHYSCGVFSPAVQSVEAAS